MAYWLYACGTFGDDEGTLMTWAVALLAAASLASASDSVTPRSSVVSPTFAWPMGTRATLEIRDNLSALGLGQSGFTRSCRIEVAPHTKGLLIACKNAKTSLSPEAKKALSHVDPKIVAGLENMLEYMRVASGFAWVVSAQGEFLGIENGPALLDGWRRAMGSSKPEGEALEKAEAMVMAQAEAQARQSWTLLVGSWRGTELKVGESRPAPSTPLASPALGGAAHATGESGAARWVDCPGEARSRCVEFFIHTAVTRDEAAPSTKDATTRPGDSQAPPATAKGTMKSVITLVAEPRTLLPHTLTVQSRIEGLIPANSQTDTEQSWLFTYKARADGTPSEPDKN